jgi:uracil-DNA glycosylase
MDKSWDAVLQPLTSELHNLLVELESSPTDEFLPSKESIFRALDLPRDQVKTIIIGQDPYPNREMAEGLAFSVPSSIALTKLPPSLRNIFTEYQSDLGYPQPSSGHLGEWVENGVLLLNRVLTVTPGKPFSHKGRGWQKVTDAILASLVPQNLPVIAWGKPAENAVRQLGFQNVIASPHPSPLSAYRGFFGSRPFSKVNEMLKRQSKEPVNWLLK